MLMPTFMLILSIAAAEALSEYDIQVATDCPPTNSPAYNVLAKQLSCFNNSDDKKLHCARHSYTNKFTVKCLFPEECRQGREPYIFDNSDHVKCQYCNDEDAYNDIPLKWSYLFNSCKKMTPLKHGKIICEDLRITTAEKYLWNHFFRCNTTANFRLDESQIGSPQTELKGVCTNSTDTWCFRYFCAKGDQELIKNYSCVPKCLADQKRDEHTLECVSKDQTVRPLTTLVPVSPQSTKKPTTAASPFQTKTEPKTTEANQQNNGDENPTTSNDWFIPLTVTLVIVVFISVIGIILFLARHKIMEFVREPYCICRQQDTEIERNDRPSDSAEIERNDRPSDSAGENSVLLEMELPLGASGDSEGEPKTHGTGKVAAAPDEDGQMNGTGGERVEVDVPSLPRTSGVRPITDELLPLEDSSAIRDPQSVSNDKDSSDDSDASIGSQAESIARGSAESTTISRDQNKVSINSCSDASLGPSTYSDPQQDIEQGEEADEAFFDSQHSVNHTVESDNESETEV